MEIFVISVVTIFFIGLVVVIRDSIIHGNLKV